MTHLLPICVKCSRQMRPVKNDVTFTTLHVGGEPMEIRAGDLVECQDCGVRVITGIASRPISEVHHSNFNECVKSYAPEYQAREYTR